MAITRHFLLLCFLTVSACGTAADGPLLSAVTSRFQESVLPDDETVSYETRKVDVLQNAKNRTGNQPVLYVELPDLQAVASMVIAAQSANVITWMDLSGVSIVTQNGIILATRGLGHDLMVSDASGTQSALRDGPPDYVRQYRYLDGLQRLGRHNFACRVEKSEGTVAEMCTGALTAFENSFTLQGNRVVESKQWLGPQLGIARTLRVQ